MLTISVVWASLNWLLDAASLWCFVAAFGRVVNPVELFAAYGIANVAGALPVTPAGLGVVDSVTPLLLVSFGVTRNVATLGVLGWRLVNFWMPIPAGAIAYASLKVPRGAGLRAMRQAVSGMMSRGDGAATAHSAPGRPSGPAGPAAAAPGRAGPPPGGRHHDQAGATAQADGSARPGGRHHGRGGRALPRGGRGRDPCGRRDRLAGRRHGTARYNQRHSRRSGKGRFRVG